MSMLTGARGPRPRRRLPARHQLLVLILLLHQLGMSTAGLAFDATEGTAYVTDSGKPAKLYKYVVATGVYTNGGGR